MNTPIKPDTVFCDDGTVHPTMRARTCRLGRLELCWCWFNGPLPSLTYIMWPGRLLHGASALTLRVGRAMAGFRWYDKTR